MAKQARILNYIWPRNEYISGDAFKLQKWRNQVIKRDLNRCQSCDNAIIDVYRSRKPSNEAHHIIPRHHGGKNTLANGVTLCFFCHDYFDLMYFAKGLDYYQVLQKITKEQRIREIKRLMYINYMRHLENIIQR